MVRSIDHCPLSSGTRSIARVDVPHVVPQKSAQSASKVNPSPFIGRQLEYDLLQNALAEAARSPGRAHVVLINGEVGIGKSMLWQTWSSSLQPGYTVVELQCLASTQALPFAPLITFLRSQQTIQRSIGSTISSSVKAISHCSWLPLIVQRMLPHRSFNSRHNGLVLVFCSISRSAL